VAELVAELVVELMFDRSNWSLLVEPVIDRADHWR
jgi:hypothetical protein